MPERYDHYPYPPDPQAQQWGQQHRAQQPVGYHAAERGHQQPAPGWGYQQPPPQPRKRRTGRTVGILLTVFGVIAVGVVGCAAVFFTAADQAVDSVDAALGGAAPPADGAPEVGVGQPVTIYDAAGNPMAKVSVAQLQTATAEPGEFGLSPQRGLFVAAQVTVIAEQDGVEVNPIYFTLVTADNQRFDATAASGGFGPELVPTSLAAGQKASGIVVWDVPTTAGHGTIAMTDWLDLSEVIASWEY